MVEKNKFSKSTPIKPLDNTQNQPPYLQPLTLEEQSMVTGGARWMEHWDSNRDNWQSNQIWHLW